MLIPDRLDDQVDSHAKPGIYKDRDFSPEMVTVPPGVFLLGRDDNDEILEGSVVTIARPIAVGRFPVTFAEWDRALELGFQGHRPDDRGWGRGRRPVMNVSWDDAVAYVKWLSHATGLQYRLLSEAEWEYCCRAGTNTPYFFGSSVSETEAVHTARKTREVGSFAPNAFGLFDMHGNVFEWCADIWQASRAGGGFDDGRVCTEGDMSRRVVRGGSWSYLGRHLGSSRRSQFLTNIRSANQGFRVARDLRDDEGFDKTVSQVRAAAGMAGIGDAYVTAGKLGAAREYYTSALRQVSEISAGHHDGDETDCAWTRIEVLRALAGVNRAEGDATSAIRQLSGALEEAQTLGRGCVAVDEFLAMVGSLQESLGDLRRLEGDLGGSREAYAASLAALRERIQRMPTLATVRRISLVREKFRIVAGADEMAAGNAESALSAEFASSLASNRLDIIVDKEHRLAPSTTGRGLSSQVLERRRALAKLLEMTAAAGEEATLRKIELASALLDVAQAAQSAQCFVDAIATYKRAVALLDELRRADCVSKDLLDVAAMAGIEARLEQVSAAKRSQQVVPDSTQARLLVAEGLEGLACALMQLGQVDKARKVLDAWGAVARASVDADLTTVPFSASQTMTSFYGTEAYRVGKLCVSIAHHDVAITCFGIIRDYSARMSEAPDGVIKPTQGTRATYRRDVAFALEAIGDVALARAQPGDALANFEEALPILTDLASERAELKMLREDLFNVHRKLGTCWLLLDDPVSCKGHYRDALDVAKEALDIEGNKATWLSLGLLVRLVLGEDVLESDRKRDGREGLLGVARQILANREKFRDYDAMLAPKLGTASYEAIKAGMFDVGLALADAGLTLAPDLLWITANRAHALMLLGRLSEARDVYLANRGCKIESKANKAFEQEVREDFCDFRRLGHSAEVEPFMIDIQSALGPRPSEHH